MSFISYKKPTNNNSPASLNNDDFSQSILTILSLLPTMLPVIAEQVLGKKIPQVTGTLAEIQNVIKSIDEISKKLDQVFEIQEVIAERIEQNEKTISEIKNQVQSVRLTHQQVTKAIEFSSNHENQLTENKNN